MSSVSLQAGTSSNSDPQLDPKRIKLDSGELLLELVVYKRVVLHKLLLLRVGKTRRAVGRRGGASHGRGVEYSQAVAGCPTTGEDLGREGLIRVVCANDFTRKWVEVQIAASGQGWVAGNKNIFRPPLKRFTCLLR